MAVLAVGHNAKRMFHAMNKNDVVKLVQPDVRDSISEELSTLGVSVDKMRQVVTSIEHALWISDSTNIVHCFKDPAHIAVKYVTSF